MSKKTPKKGKFFARDKLEETLYFLLQMRLSYVDRTLFLYNTDAFLSSARSVTFALQTQFKGNPKFDVWYSQKTEGNEEKQTIRFFR